MNPSRILPLIAVLASVQAQQPPTAPHADRVAAPVPPGAAAAFRDIEYVAKGHERQKLDLFLPSSGTNWPLLVWVHGGAWRAGTKEGGPALRLLKEGFAVASINYRLSQHAIFPAQLHDCKTAIRWLRVNAASYGYDPTRFGVWGSSAGGHLAALLGTAGDVREFEQGPHPDVSSRVQAVVDFLGPRTSPSCRSRLEPRAGWTTTRLAHLSPG